MIGILLSLKGGNLSCELMVAFGCSGNTTTSSAFIQQRKNPPWSSDKSVSFVCQRHNNTLPENGIFPARWICSVSNSKANCISDIVKGCGANYTFQCIATRPFLYPFHSILHHICSVKTVPPALNTFLSMYMSCLPPYQRYKHILPDDKELFF